MSLLTILYVSFLRILRSSLTSVCLLQDIEGLDALMAALKVWNGGGGSPSLTVELSLANLAPLFQLSSFLTTLLSFTRELQPRYGFTPKLELTSLGFPFTVSATSFGFAPIARSRNSTAMVSAPNFLPSQAELTRTLSFTHSHRVQEHHRPFLLNLLPILHR